MKTNLIIVEGLPGSGKSTTAGMIGTILRDHGENVCCVDEGTANHPADFADYDFPDFSTERTMILGKWKSFVNTASRDTVYVFNCVFLQNPMCETMMRFGMDEDASQRYIYEIAEIIKPLSPVVFYIDTPDAKSMVDRVLDERGDGWLNAVIEYHVAQGYGKAHELSGYDGYIKCLEERRRRELRILQSIDINSFLLRPFLSADELADFFTGKNYFRKMEI